MKRAGLIVIVIVAAAACGAQQSTTETPASSGWKQIVLEWTYGPCPQDGRSCHQTLTVDANGGFVAEETPNSSDPKPESHEPVRRFAALERQETREMNRIVTRDFVSHLDTIACSPVPDATVTLKIDGRLKDISSCALSSAPSPAHDLVALLGRHRFASHDQPADHPVVPTGAGDTCDTSTGCGKGLQCVASPCVVAPCTSGTCQKL